MGWYYDVFLRQRSLYTEITINEEPWVRERRRKALGPSLLLVAAIGTALVYLWFAGYVTKAKPAVSQRLKIEPHAGAHAGPSPAALWLCGRILGGAAIDVAAVYKPG
jgi:hypothetical protein